jgi:hypothetical protein
MPRQRYRLVLFNDSGSHVVLDNGHHLPEVTIPQFTRPAEQITSRLREELGIPTVLLGIQQSDLGEGIWHAILEGYKGDWGLPPGFGWNPISEAESRVNESDGSLVKARHAKAVRPHLGLDPAPFSRLGWIYSLQTWIQNIVGPAGIKPGRFLQLSGSDNTALVSFETSNVPLWFKAVGDADPQEFTNTQILSVLFSEYLPPVLALDTLHNAWLMESGGEPLGRHKDLATWMKVVQRLASLQIDSVTRSSDLLRAGCRDVRNTMLLDLVSPFFEVIDDLMKRQTTTAAPPLEKQELFEVATILREAIAESSELGIPDTLGHSDFNPGNILIAEDRCVFIDWSAAHVGNPLLTLEYLLAHRRRNCWHLLAEEHELREAYAQHWRIRVAPDRLARALQLAPLVAVYACAIYNNSWRDPARLARPEVAGHLRSLVRIMKREGILLTKGRSLLDA